MKRLLAVILVLVMCFLTASCAQKTDDKLSDYTTTASSTTTDTKVNEKLKVGFAEVDFTPCVKMGYMPGQFGHEISYRETSGELFASAVAFSCGGNSLIMISMDVLSFKAEYGNDMRRRISEATGVPTENILIAATHTHTGPALEYQLWLTDPDPVISANTADKTVEAGIAAWNSREDAKLGTKSGYNSDYNFCRVWHMKDGTVKMNPGTSGVDKPISAVDHSVNVMRIEDTKGNIKGMIVNYANHLDNISPKNTYSADYVKYLREGLREEYGEDLAVVFFNGAAGDVNRNDYSGEKPRATVDKIGYGIAETAIKINRHIKTSDTVKIQSLSQIHQTVRRKETIEQYEWAVEVMSRVNKGYNVGGKDHAFAAEYIEPEDPNLPDTVDMEIHTIQIGDWAIVGIPGEVFSEIGLNIKKNSPFTSTLIFELANGTHGYLTPDHIQVSETYEAQYSKYNAYTGLGTADMLIEKSEEMLDKLYANK